MKLSELIKNCPLVSSRTLDAGEANNPDITSIASDSRDVKPGGLFIAVNGFSADGHDYIEQAIEKGAVAVIAERNPDNLDHIILVESSRLSMACIASNFYGNPSNDMTLVGITGTNGKTTTTWLLESIFNACGFSTGVIGTVNIRFNDQIFDTPVTTPDSIDLQKTLHDMKTAGVTHVIMEVSSHGLELNRVDFCNFDAGIFTNLTQDHLDFHKDMDMYFESKKRLFTQFLGPNSRKNAPAVLNIDDPKGQILSDELGYKTICISTKQATTVFAENIKDDIHGLSGIVHLPGDSFHLTSSLIGTFNLENILCAAGAASALHIKSEQIKKGLENCKSIPGRLEKIETPIDRFMFVDYAHTPDALKSILTHLKQRAPKRIITVFGCGGDRDRSKRPLMGDIACCYSDIAIITSDNSRSEDPLSIINDILKGVKKCHQLSYNGILKDPFAKGYLVEADRKKALKKAVFISKPGDIIIAAGKGHETYQITNNGTIHFDDKEEIITAVNAFVDQFTPIPWTINDLSGALDCNPVFAAGKNEGPFTGISTDSRNISTTQVFLALKGESFDGHEFIKDLIQTGIKGFIVEPHFLATLEKDTVDKITQEGIVIFETENTLTALGRLGQFQRLRADVKVVAITGSSGKTTTRKITEEIFKTQFHTHATIGNFNNEIGLPLTLLNLSKAHEWAIVEMGMNHPGEISRLSQIALPDIAMVINTAGVHLEGLGSVENVAKAKAEIFDGMKNGSTAILWSDDPRRTILESKVTENSHITSLLFFGSHPENHVHALDIKTRDGATEFRLRFDSQEDTFYINSPARFMVNNCMAAICAAMTAGIGKKGLKKGIQSFFPVSGRMNIYSLSASVHIIDDTYNANPASVTQALNTLKAVSKGQNSIAILGDMLELGKTSGDLHRQIGQKAAQSGISKLFIFGEQVKHIKKGAIEKGFSEDHIFHGGKKEIAQKALQGINTETWILVKGSRGMAMEHVISELKQMLTVNS